MKLVIRTTALAALAASFVAAASAQEMPLSGTFGVDVVYATTPGGSSRMYAISPTASLAPIPIGPSVNNVPSRWAHRRRTLQGLETSIAYGAPATLFTPMGSVAGTGAIHVIDARTGFPPTSLLVPTGNPAAYDLAVVDSLKYLFSAEDDGFGNTLLRGYSWATPGTLVPLTPPGLSLPGPPSSYVNRIDVNAALGLLQVPTSAGIAVVSISASAPQISLSKFVSTGTNAPVTNPTSFVTATGRIWIIGTATFTGGGAPTSAGWQAWDAGVGSSSGSFGIVPSVPSKSWVPAIGAEELAVVSNVTATFVYVLLREPGPGTGFVKGSAIGCSRWLGATPISTGTIPLTDACGEPFSIPTVSGTRVAFESSFGAPFIVHPTDGGERVNVLYSPIDPLGAASPFGVVGVPGPLGGRISIPGMDRPIWSKDGTRIFAFSSDFPGVGNPLVPGVEVQYVPASVVLNEFTAPHQILTNPLSDMSSIIFPSIFQPRDPFYANLFGNLTFVGNMFDTGMGGALAAQFGEIAQYQDFGTIYSLNPDVPGFPSILPPAFNDALGSLTPVPNSFGARRTSFNVLTQYGIYGLTMVAAIDDRIYLQPTGTNTVASLGLAAPISVFTFALPAGSITTTEFLSL